MMTIDSVSIMKKLCLQKKDKNGIEKIRLSLQILRPICEDKNKKRKKKEKESDWKERKLN